MKILFVHPNNDYTGSTKVLSDILSEQYSNDECMVLTIDTGHGFLSDKRNVLIKKIWFPVFSTKYISLLVSLISLLHRVFLFTIYCLKSDLIYINTIKPYYAATLAHIFGKQMIWHIHEVFREKTIPVKIMEFTQRNVDAHFIFVSNYVKDCYTITYSSTCEVKYNKLSEHFLQKVRYVDPLLRSRKVILMPSSLTSAKGIYKFVELARLMPDYSFRLVLSCSDLEKDEFVREVNPTDNCVIYSRQSDLSSFYRSADVVLNLSNPLLCIETFGMTIIEAFAYGIPVIGPSVGGPVEIINHGVNGFCIDVTNVELLKRTIIDITEDIKQYSLMCIEALNASKRFI